MQKRVAGAIEMYNLDNSENITKLNKETLGKLKQKGYLKELPKDSYRIDHKGKILCLRHGYIGQKLTSRSAVLDELERRGCKDEELLSAAAAEAATMQSSARTKKWQEMSLYRVRYAVGAVVFLCFAFCYWGFPIVD